MKAKTRKAAWEIADELFPEGYTRDARRSDGAGYDTYTSNVNYYAYICDLGDRLELNFADGKTVNVWIEMRANYYEYQVADALEVVSECIYQIDDKINDNLARDTGIEDARRLLYGAYAKLRDVLDCIKPDSELYKKYNLDEA